MQEDLFTEMDMGKNIQKLEDELGKLMGLFQKATGTQVEYVYLLDSPTDNPKIVVRFGKRKT